MPKIILTGIPGLDGEYELDMNFTYRDFRTIKQVAGVRANEVQDALAGGDTDLIVALAEIALRRAGKQHSVDELLDAEAGAITLDADDMAEADAGPPAVSSGDEPRSEPESRTSGSSTNGATEPSPETSKDDSSGTPRLVSSSVLPTSTT